MESAFIKFIINSFWALLSLALNPLTNTDEPLVVLAVLQLDFHHKVLVCCFSWPCSAPQWFLPFLPRLIFFQQNKWKTSTTGQYYL